MPPLQSAALVKLPLMSFSQWTWAMRASAPAPLGSGATTGGESIHPPGRSTYRGVEEVPTSHSSQCRRLQAAGYQNLTRARMDRLHAAGFEAPFATLEEGVGGYARPIWRAAIPIGEGGQVLNWSPAAPEPSHARAWSSGSLGRSQGGVPARCGAGPAWKAAMAWASGAEPAGGSITVVPPWPSLEVVKTAAV